VATISDAVFWLEPGLKMDLGPVICKQATTMEWKSQPKPKIKIKNQE
jgi:hypothetical protein